MKATYIPPEDDNKNPLETYAVNLTASAKAGRIDPVIGRDNEVRRVIQILSRRTKNNPVLLGDPGVGKTAIVEGLAQRIVNGDVPGTLKYKQLLVLDLAALLAGAQYRGQFEQRLKSVLFEIEKAQDKYILFIDELHTLVSAGAAEGAVDASNMLKPALARGLLHAIGATTVREYRQYIERDPALERRFQPIYIDEPTVEDSIAILRGIKEKYETHHGIKISDDAVIAAVTLSVRYISDRYLPDKAIDLVDEAAAAAKIEIDSMPTSLDEIKRKTIQLDIELAALKKEKGVDERKKQLEKQRNELQKEFDRLDKLWEHQKKIIEQLQRARLELDWLKIELETAEREALFDDEKNIVRIDMTEYSEAHSVARLIGAPPGYVGYEEGGQLTEAVRRKPYSVILFDEIEKAHPQIFNIFLQILDDGRLTDGRGRIVNFKNTIIIMTSNLGSEILAETSTTPGVEERSGRTPGVNQEKLKKVMSLVRSFFKPEFLNRIDSIILFNPLDKNMMAKIVELQLKQAEQRINKQDVKIEFTDNLKKYLLEVGFDEIALQILEEKIKPNNKIILDWQNNKLSIKTKAVN